MRSTMPPYSLEVIVSDNAGCLGADGGGQTISGKNKWILHIFKKVFTFYCEKKAPNFRSGEQRRSIYQFLGNVVFDVPRINDSLARIQILIYLFFENSKQKKIITEISNFLTNFTTKIGFACEICMHLNSRRCVYNRFTVNI